MKVRIIFKMIDSCLFIVSSLINIYLFFMIDLNNTLALISLDFGTPRTISTFEESKQDVCTTIDIIHDVLLIIQFC